METVKDTTADTELESLLAHSWTEERIQRLLETDDHAVLRGLYRLYLRQTSGEQASKSTQCKNGVGFSASDASFLTRKAECMLRNGWLSHADIAMVRPLVIKYRRQLLEIALAGGRK